MFGYCEGMAGRRGTRSSEQQDRILGSKCHGEAWRRILDGGESVSAIVDEIRRLAGGRRHVLVEMAGVGVGAWAARPSLPATELLTAGILLAAADASSLDELDRWLVVGRQRALQAPHTAS
jgi:hypothetical protein